MSVQHLWQGILHRPWLADTILGAVATCVMVSLTVLAYPRTADAMTFMGFLWMAAGVIPVTLRQYHPWLTTLSMSAYSCLSVIIMTQVGIVDTGVSTLIVAYTMASHLRMAQALATTAVIWIPPTAMAAYAATAQWEPRAPQPEQAAIEHSLFVGFLATTVVAVVVFLVGRTMWTRRAYAEASRDKADAAEANQRALAVQAVAEERRRIARELHDVVAHHISVMSILATGARKTLERNPSAADEALATIEQTGWTVLREMRRLLDILRSTDTDDDHEEKPAPQPGIAAITTLIDQVKETGLPVTFTSDTAVDQLDPGLALTVYRIIQEALTNTIKHAGPATVDVRMAIRDDWLELVVTDTGQGPQLDGNRCGHGLMGMRERVALFGGVLRVGPRPGGGYRVYAHIPVEGIHQDHPPIQELSVTKNTDRLTT